MCNLQLNFPFFAQMRAASTVWYKIRKTRDEIIHGTLSMEQHIMQVEFEKHKNTIQASLKTMEASYSEELSHKNEWSNVYAGTLLHVGKYKRCKRCVLCIILNFKCNIWYHSENYKVLHVLFVIPRKYLVCIVNLCV